MKYLDNNILIHLSNILSNIRTPETRINVRFEAYSVKPIGKERKMYREMEEAYMSGQEEMEEMSFSPEMKEAGLSSCFGRLDEKESRKVHFLLVSTLNSAFPDHDFHALQPNQFTRERSAADVLSGLTTSLLGSGSSSTPMVLASLSSLSNLSPPEGKSSPAQQTIPLASSPNPPANMPNPQIYRVLNEVIPLEECEVYSWFPEPEYDPHIDEDDGEASEWGEQSKGDGTGTADTDMDVEPPASWGAGGMELDDLPSSSMLPPRSASMGGNQEMEDDSMRGQDLLWSQNFFFYSKRQKRVLFLTCWCRKRPSQFPPPPGESSDFPASISTSFSPPTSFSPAIQAQARSLRMNKSHNRSNPRPGHRKSKLNIKDNRDTSTIPIRGMETPRPAAMPTPTRLAASAPSSFLGNNSPQAALAKMTAGGFKPRQPTARIMINAAAATNRVPTTANAARVDGKRVGAPSDPNTTEARVRKDRSESTASGSSRMADLVGAAAASKNVDTNVKGKRVRV